jgi:hypothetical protein
VVAPPPTQQTVRYLEVGNSFSRNATWYLASLAQAANCPLVHHYARVGGSSMDVHWGMAEAFERNPQDKAGLYPTGKSLHQELLAEPWDVVTIQQVSIKSHDVSTYRPYAAQLKGYILEHAPRARLLLHQTWAYRRDDPRFAVATPAPGEPATQEAMYRGLCSAYDTIGAELGASRIPVGDAFWLADTDPTWGYRVDPRFDPLTAVFPALPNQAHSLHVGWTWQKQADGGRTLVMDGHHAGPAGQYLGSCVFFEVLFGRSVVGNTFAPGNLQADYVRFLQETAHRAVAARALTAAAPRAMVPPDTGAGAWRH